MADRSPAFVRGRMRTILLAVMGVAGAGKTSFISEATGQQLHVGDSLEPSTSGIQAHSFSHRGARVTLVDTPGFDATTKPDIVILEDFIGFLRRMSSNGLHLSGIIYLHRITDTRMQGSAIRNLALLRELCGDDFLPHVVFVTTMWKRIDREVGEAREENLMSRYWGNMMDRGATTARYEGTRDSALGIIDKFMTSPPPTGTMSDIERESVLDRKPLLETHAGRAILEGLREKVHQQERKLRDAENSRRELEWEDQFGSNAWELQQLQIEILKLSEELGALKQQEIYITNGDSSAPGERRLDDPRRRRADVEFNPDSNFYDQQNPPPQDPYQGLGYSEQSAYPQRRGERATGGPNTYRPPPSHTPEPNRAYGDGYQSPPDHQMQSYNYSNNPARAQAEYPYPPYDAPPPASTSRSRPPYGNFGQFPEPGDDNQDPAYNQTQGGNWNSWQR